MNKSIISIVLIIITILLLSFYINWNNIFKPDWQEVKKDVHIMQFPEVPLSAVNKRLVIVSHHGNADYRTIQDALDASQPGDTIQVKNGVYVERVNVKRSGTRDLPITVVNYPGHNPVIDPGGGSYPPSCCPSGGTPRVEFNAEWIILEGFEIRYGWDGVKVYQGHNTIRNNWIHNNRYQGILVVSAGDVFIEGNKIHNNGTDPGACFSEEWGGESPRHCHGIYISDHFCKGAPYITIRGNVIRKQAGYGIQWNGKDCNSVIKNNFVENNLIMNNAGGMSLYHNVSESTISNNTFITDWYPPTNQSDYALLAIFNSNGNIFRNNVFYSMREDVQGISVITIGIDKNEFKDNRWCLKSDGWKWNGIVRGFFRMIYHSLSGDKNAAYCKDYPMQ